MLIARRRREEEIKELLTMRYNCHVSDPPHSTMGRFILLAGLDHRPPISEAATGCVIRDADRSLVNLRYGRRRELE